MLYAASRESDKLLQIIGALAGAKKKPDVVSLFAGTFCATPIEKQDVVLIGDFALRFDGDDTLVEVFRSVPGTTERAETVIEEIRRGD